MINRREWSFQFLVSRADQGDLEEAKQMKEYKEDPGFRKVIDDAFPKAEYAGARHDRFVGREIAKLAIMTLDEVWELKNGSKSQVLSLHPLLLVNSECQN